MLLMEIRESMMAGRRMPRGGEDGPPPPPDNDMEMG